MESFYFMAFSTNPRISGIEWLLLNLSYQITMRSASGRNIG